MHVRHKKKCPFLLRLERLLHMRRVPIHNHSKMGLGTGCELGSLERNTLFSELLIGVERLADGFPAQATGAKAYQAVRGWF